MLKPKENIDLPEFERFGFKKCRGEYAKEIQQEKIKRTFERMVKE